MAESTTPAESKWWKRPLRGGLFSTAAAIMIIGIVFALSSMAEWPDFLVPFLYPLAFVLAALSLGITAPAELMGLRENHGLPGISASVATLIFWFLVGTLITYVEKNTRRVGIWWLLLLVALTFINASLHR